MNKKILLALCLASTPSHALEIQFNYSYDTTGFFSASGNPEGATGAAKARAALQAVGKRYGELIITDLAEANFVDDNRDSRISFVHPGNGAILEISPAVTVSSDVLKVVPASDYRGPWSIPEDTMIIYAGAYNIAPLAEAGTSLGTNVSTTYSDINSPINRGFGSSPSFPYSRAMWGGSLTFDTSATWHLDHTTAPAAGKVDFYSVALHEVGHIMGLATRNWKQNRDIASSSTYLGTSAIAAYNRFATPNVSSLSLTSSSNYHFLNDEYQSPIFPVGSVNYLGTIGAGAPQQLLMDSAQSYSSPRRYELTYVDVAALKDVGWTVISDTPLPETVSIAAGMASVDVSFPSQSGEDYAIQASQDLINWQVASVSPASSNTTTWSDSDTVDVVTKFYRVAPVQ